MSGKPTTLPFFDEATYTVSYLVADEATKQAAVIDPVLDYDHKSGTADTRSAEAILKVARNAGYSIVWVLETHVHADHLSAAPYFKVKTGAKIGIGEHVRDVQQIFRPVFNATDMDQMKADFDHLFTDGEHFKLGEIDCEALHTPGHTPACVSFKIADAVFVGDTIFMPDYGTARADFPGGNAGTLYQSIQKLLSLPPETRLFMCHDYKAPGRDTYAWETTVAEERTRNVHVREGVSEDEFVKMRTTRDATLAAPVLLLPSIQINMRAGRFPPAEQNGVRYLAIPVKFRGEAQVGI